MKEGIIIRDKCPICSSTTSEHIFDRSFNDEILMEYMNINYHGHADIGFLKDVRFEIVKCKKCKLSYQKNVLDEGRLTELYNKWIDPVLAQTWHEEGKSNALAGYAKTLNFVKEYFNREPNKIKVLDYGAGYGDSLIVAKEMGFESYAYEYSIERIHFMEDNGIKVIDEKNTMLFDFIIVDSVFEHLNRPDEILKLLISKLNKNGLLYLQVPNCPNIKKNLAKANTIKDATILTPFFISISINAFQHVNFFNSSTLHKLFKKNKIKPIGPFRQAVMKPLTIKSFIRPFYYTFYKNNFVTNFFLTKKG
jgi:2-polyprenyl-3-methyl-5-hydroxy-6-metoxy-1,4-benzoquinol methylase